MRRSAIRSGDEPAHARSPLRLRLILAVLGIVWGIAGVVVFALAHAPLLEAGFGLAALAAAANTAVVIRHLRAGPHYQPGPSIPPYRPVDPEPAVSAPPRPPASSTTRLHRYLALMSFCLILLVLAWGWVRLFSTGLAAAMTLVAMVIPPIAAIVANMGAPSDGPDHPDHPGPPDRTPLGRRPPQQPH